MRFSSLVFATVLLASPILAAQHASSGSSAGSSGSASVSSPPSPPVSSSSRGSSGGSVYSGSPHSSSPGARASAGTASRSSRASGARPSPGYVTGGVEETKNAPIAGKPSPPKHSRLVSILLFPFEKPNADHHRPTSCDGKPCVCPTGTTARNGACVASTAFLGEIHHCRDGEFWEGDSCTSMSLFRVNDCSNLAQALDRQSHHAQTVERDRQATCSAAASSRECEDATSQSQSEDALYQSLKEQYDRCRGIPAGLRNRSKMQPLQSATPRS